MAKILGIGIVTIDIINLVSTYPQEDSEVRALQQQRCPGGNVTNSMVILSQLGQNCFWAGNCVDNLDGRWILNELRNQNIDTSNCHLEAQGSVPTSYICLSQDLGSRTIVHYRDLAEFRAASFNTIELSNFDWLHFEGRNPEELAIMLQKAKSTVPKTPISLEVEKPRPGIEKLFIYADVLLFSRNYVQGLGLQAAEFLQELHQKYPTKILICAWGEQGAYAIAVDGKLTHSQAFPPEVIIDTLGAGDTFNAAIIDALCQDFSQSMQQLLTTACKLAGQKCGHFGLKI